MSQKKKKSIKDWNTESAMENGNLNIIQNRNITRANLIVTVRSLIVTYETSRSS